MFTNPSLINPNFATTELWAVRFSDAEFNTLGTVGGGSIFPASDVSFKEYSMSNASLAIGPGGALDMSVPSAVQKATRVDISFLDEVNQEVNTLIRNWILSSPVNLTGRSLNIHKPSAHTKGLIISKLDREGKPLSSYGNLSYTVFPTEELVQLFNSNPEARVDKLSLRCY